MKCHSGYCLTCDKEIAPVVNGKRRPGNQYTEVFLDWSNGSRMRTAVCVDCAKANIWTADRSEMTKAIQEAWDAQGGTYDKAVVLV